MGADEQPERRMVFASCPSCKLINHLTCPNCGIDDWFHLVPGGARCYCETTTDRTLCKSCGTAIPAQAFYVDPHQEQHAKTHKAAPAAGQSAAPKKHGPLAKVLAGVGGLVLAALGVLIFAHFDGGSGCDGSKVGRKIEAYVSCQEFVKERLKAPSQATFPGWDASNEGPVKITADGDTYEVKSYVDAPNSFGAKLRSSFTCKVERTGDKKWRLVDLQMSQ